MTVLWRISLSVCFATTIFVIAGMGQEKLITVALGHWGGTGVNFVVEKNSTSIEYDCAAGKIPGQLKVDKRGNFAMDGSHKLLYPGALRLNLTPKILAVRYEGKITANTLRYKVILKETGELVGEFSAERDKEGRVRGCR